MRSANLVACQSKKYKKKHEEKQLTKGESSVFSWLLLHLVYDILSLVCCCFVTLVKFSEAHKKVTIRFVCWNEGEKKKNNHQIVSFCTQE